MPEVRPSRKSDSAAQQTIFAGKGPQTLVSDGAANFHEAYLKEFRTQRLETRAEHIRLQGNFNNKMERMNGEIRDRERVMRTLEK